jgi:hypothetical protein
MIRFAKARRKSALIRDKTARPTGQLRRTSASGEGMQQDRNGGRKGCRRRGVRNKPAARVALAIVLAGLVATLDASMLRAADNNEITVDENAWNRMLTRLGLKKPPDADGEIDYTERSPLVVPRTRDLPPPGTLAVAPAADWPVDQRKPRKHAGGKPPVVPDTAVQTPNPPYVKPPWYNPMGWFNREEYANFPGEPVRQNLTDPPAGYRIPSAEQPYGINPEKKPVKKVAGDGTPVQTGPQGAGQNPPPAASQAPAPQAAAAPTQPGQPIVLAPQPTQ